MTIRWFTAYDAISGEIVATFVSSEDLAELNAPLGSRLVRGQYFYQDGYFKDNLFIAYGEQISERKRSERPTYAAVWDNTKMCWVDARDVETAWRDLRRERDLRLSSSDWTQAADAPVDQAAWAAYRQALRDLPANTVDPRYPIWPNPPA